MKITLLKSPTVGAFKPTDTPCLCNLTTIFIIFLLHSAKRERDTLPKHTHEDLPHQLHAISIIKCIFRVAIEGVIFSKIRFFMNKWWGKVLVCVWWRVWSQLCADLKQTKVKVREEPPANVNPLVLNDVENTQTLNIVCLCAVSCGHDKIFKEWNI